MLILGAGDVQRSHVAERFGGVGGGLYAAFASIMRHSFRTVLVLMSASTAFPRTLLPAALSHCTVCTNLASPSALGPPPMRTCLRARASTVTGYSR